MAEEVRRVKVRVKVSSEQTLQTPQSGCGEWRALVTDQTSEAPGGNGIDGAISWKMTKRKEAGGRVFYPHGANS